MKTLTLEQLRRAEKLELTIHGLCEKGVRDAEEYLDVLQAINDGKKVGVITPPVFLTPSEQWKGFVGYNQWLREKHPEHIISEEEMKAMEARLAELDPEALIFYCHGGDVVLTAKLAWEYICSYRRKAWKNPDVRFESGYIKPDEREPARPAGFYILKRPPEDKEAVGKKFQGQAVQGVRQKVGQDWGMGSEGIQFVGITHRHYPELMDGQKFPFIDLPALAVSPRASGHFGYAFYLDVSVGLLRLRYDSVGGPVAGFGSGSLRQC